jgi:hypothetical protein
MLSKLLLATDASEASDRVVDCVRHLRAIGAREALLVHVLNVRDVGGLSVTLRRAILLTLEAQQQTLAAAGFHTQSDAPSCSTTSSSRPTSPTSPSVPSSTWSTSSERRIRR